MNVLIYVFLMLFCMFSFLFCLFFGLVWFSFFDFFPQEYIVYNSICITVTYIYEIECRSVLYLDIKPILCRYMTFQRIIWVLWIKIDLGTRRSEYEWIGETQVKRIKICFIVGTVFCLTRCQFSLLFQPDKDLSPNLMFIGIECNVYSLVSVCASITCMCKYHMYICGKHRSHELLFIYKTNVFRLMCCIIRHAYFMPLICRGFVKRVLESVNLKLLTKNNSWC